MCHRRTHLLNSRTDEGMLHQRNEPYLEVIRYTQNLQRVYLEPKRQLHTGVWRMLKSLRQEPQGYLTIEARFYQ